MTTSGSDTSWPARLLDFRRAVDIGDAEGLRAAREQLRERGAQQGLQPDEAELLGQINMVIDEG